MYFIHLQCSNSFKCCIFKISKIFVCQVAQLCKKYYFLFAKKVRTTNLFAKNIKNFNVFEVNYIRFSPPYLLFISSLSLYSGQKNELILKIDMEMIFWINLMQFISFTRKEISPKHVNCILIIEIKSYMLIIFYHVL